MTENTEDRMLDNIDPNKVQSVSSAGVSVNFRSEKETFETELAQRRSEYNPINAMFATKWQKD